MLGLAWAYIAHTDSRFDPESLRRMVHAYQEVEPLTIGELWAIAISLRILLVENLRRLAERIVRSRADRQAADELADRLLGLADDGASDASRRDRAGCRAPSSRPPVASSSSSVSGTQDPAVTPALRWLEQLLASQGTTAEELVQLEHQRMATMNVTVRNVITSMRLISWFDWAEFVESVEPGRRRCFGRAVASPRWTSRPATGTATRSRSSPVGRGRTEVEVARRAVEMAGARVRRPDATDVADAAATSAIPATT